MALQRHSGYRPSDLKECVLAIHDIQLNRKGSSSRAVRDKYTQNKVLQCTVSAFVSDLMCLPSKETGLRNGCMIHWIPAIFLLIAQLWLIKFRSWGCS